jgi:TRAP-type uncharacterized transport system substrate-binding protein
MMTMIFRLLSPVAILLIASCPLSFAEPNKSEITAMTTPFGSAGYSITMAIEETFKKADALVAWKTKETPGAMYIFKYMFLNRDNIASGNHPQVVVPIQSGLLRYVKEGWPPFEKIPNPDLRALFSLPAAVNLMVTFDPEIKELRDLSGKKVGVTEKGRFFTNDAVTRPYFEKGLGIWEEVHWNYLGSINSKDALLNNRIHAKLSLFIGNLELSSDGRYICSKLVPEDPTMQLMDSGRRLYILDWDPKLIEASYDVDKDMALLPLLIKKGACKGIDRDRWGLFSVGQIVGSISMPDHMVLELIRVRHEYREAFGKYHPMLNLLPTSPYPLGVPKDFVHPGVGKAMKKLGLPIPE